jgi:hypothetical protein
MKDNNKNNYFELVMGYFIGILFILIFFGTSIVPKSHPNIQINIGDIVRNSHIYIFNKHIHHWLIGICVLLLVFCIEQYYSSKYFSIIKGFTSVIIVHGLLYGDRFDLS